MNLVVLDGPIATQLQLRGYSIQAPTWAIAANDAAPDVVRAIHFDYQSAGASELGLNSFGLSAGLHVDEDGLELQQRAQRAVLHARSVSKLPLRAALSFAAVGSRAEQQHRLIEEARALLRSGIKNICIETVTQPSTCDGLAASLWELLESHDATLEWSFVPNTTTADAWVEMLDNEGWLTTRAHRLRGIGFNCGTPAACVEALVALEARLQETKPPVLVRRTLRPHCSTVDEHGTWITHGLSVERWERAFLDIWKRVKGSIPTILGVGVCCGGTPDHIRVVARYIAEWSTGDFPQ